MTIYIKDPLYAWIFRQTKRSVATLLAITVISFVASIALRTIALFIDALHGALHELLFFCESINHTFVQSGLVGQFVMICLVGGSLVFIIYRCGRWLYESRGGMR
jgi:hypothetical protein